MSDYKKKEISVVLSSENYIILNSLFLWERCFSQKYYYSVDDTYEYKNNTYMYILEKSGSYIFTVCKINKIKNNIFEKQFFKKSIDSNKNFISKKELFEITGEKYDKDFICQNQMYTERKIYYYDCDVTIYLDLNKFLGITDYELIIEFDKELPKDLISKLESFSIKLDDLNLEKYHRFVKQLEKTNGKILKLPMVIPPYVTYQGMAFMLGIIISNYNTMNYVYNNFIAIGCKNTDELWELKIELIDILWDSLSIEGIFEQDYYEIKNYVRKDRINIFFKERLEQDWYILLYNIDEYYLSFSDSFKKEHFIHDLYIYGYENDTFCVMAYKNEKLQLFNVSQTEIRNAIWACQNPSFCTCRPNKKIKIEVNYNKIKNNIINYCNGKEEDNYIYGIRIYDAIINSLNNFINNKEKNIDMRVFRMLWEHKKIFKMQLLKLQEKQDIGNSIEHAINVERTGNKVFMLGIKFRLTGEFSDLKKMIELLELMRDEEIDYLNILISLFKKN